MSITQKAHIVPPRRIDVHHHIIPPDYLKALKRAGISEPIPGVDYPTWDVSTDLAVMDRQGIATAIVSLSEPGVLFGGTHLHANWPVRSTSSQRV